MALKHTFLRTLQVLVITLMTLLAVTWAVFIPSAREPGYVFVKAWGEPGAGPGQFSDPTGIAVVDGEVFVADARNGRIQVFDLEGNFIRQFGRPGDGLGELGRPMNLSLRAGELYVPEYFNDRIQVFGLDGTPKRTLGETGTGPGQFSAPGGVAVSEDGHLFVADFYNQRVQELTADGGFVQQWGTTGKIGVAAGKFNYPTDVALGENATLYVADGYADRVQAFAADGDFLSKWGGPFAMNIFGPFNGWFATVTSLAVDPEGNVFVADFYNDRVQKFASDGTFLTTFGETGKGPGQFQHAMAVAIAEDGSVFVTDLLNNRIQKWQPREPLNNSMVTLVFIRFRYRGALSQACVGLSRK
ncbi:MAG: NHL repeat-containing protein, partial [Pseudomonadales bacterium]|nr:NHL repeat-containing protein [Pseudomonadales bacterium]